jgi:hypothetical protein
VRRADNHRFGRLLIAFLTLTALVLAGPAASGRQKRIAGYIESVRIMPGDLILRAKVDTGAEHSSLDARHIEEFLRDAKPWLRFSVTDQSNRTIVVERPVHRVARIRRHAGRIQERAVVLLGICLGATFKTAEVNLVNRAGFDYPMLIGRSFLDGDFLVDPGERFVLEPACPNAVQ